MLVSRPETSGGKSTKPINDNKKIQMVGKLSAVEKV